MTHQIIKKMKPSEQQSVSSDVAEHLRWPPTIILLCLQRGVQGQFPPLRWRIRSHFTFTFNLSWLFTPQLPHSPPEQIAVIDGGPADKESRAPLPVGFLHYRDISKAVSRAEAQALTDLIDRAVHTIAPNAAVTLTGGFRRSLLFLSFWHFTVYVFMASIKKTNKKHKTNIFFHLLNEFCHQRIMKTYSASWEICLLLSSLSLSQMASRSLWRIIVRGDSMHLAVNGN